MTPEETKSLRQALGWSQEKLAREVGVSFCTVNRWERGRSSPSPMAVNMLNKLKEKTGLNNRRANVRFELRYPIKVLRLDKDAELPDSAAAVPAFTENLNFSGLMFKNEADFRYGERLYIDLMLDEKWSVKAISEVVWLAENSREKKVGVKFNRMTHRDVLRVMNTIRMNKP